MTYPNETTKQKYFFIQTKYAIYIIYKTPLRDCPLIKYVSKYKHITHICTLIQNFVVGHMF